MLERKREEYCRDLEKFSDLINKLKEHKKTSEEKVRDKNKEFKALEEELATTNLQVEKIRVMLASQGITIEDARRLQSEKAHIEDGISKAATTRHEYNKALWELEMELSRESSDLESVASQYNNKAADLADSSGHGKNITIDIERKYVAESDQRLLLGGADISGEILPRLEALKQSFIRQISEKKQQLLQLLDQEQFDEEAQTEASDKTKV